MGIRWQLIFVVDKIGWEFEWISIERGNWDWDSMNVQDDKKGW